MISRRSTKRSQLCAQGPMRRTAVAHCAEAPVARPLVGCGRQNEQCGASA